MEWSEIIYARDNNKHDDHVKCMTPIGEVVVNWKSWDEYDHFDIYINDDYIGFADSLEKAKDIAHNKLTEICESLGRFLGIFVEEPEFHHVEGNIKHLNAMI